MSSARCVRVVRVCFRCVIVLVCAWETPLFDGCVIPIIHSDVNQYLTCCGRTQNREHAACCRNKLLSDPEDPWLIMAAAATVIPVCPMGMTGGGAPERSPGSNFQSHMCGGFLLESHWQNRDDPRARARRFQTQKLSVLHEVEPITLVWKDLEVTASVRATGAYYCVGGRILCNVDRGLKCGPIVLIQSHFACTLSFINASRSWGWLCVTAAEARAVSRPCDQILELRFGLAQIPRRADRAVDIVYRKLTFQFSRRYLAQRALVNSSAFSARGARARFQFLNARAP